MNTNNEDANLRGGASVEDGPSDQPIRFAGSVLGAKRHVCAFFHNRDEEYRVLLPFIRDGLERGQKAFHIVDPKLRKEHLERLSSGGIDVAAAEQSVRQDCRFRSGPRMRRSKSSKPHWPKHGAESRDHGARQPGQAFQLQPWSRRSAS